MHCIQFYYVWKKVCLPEYCKIRGTWEGSTVDDDLNNNHNRENANSQPNILFKLQPSESKVKEEKQDNDDEDATLDALALIAEDEGKVQDTSNPDTKIKIRLATAAQPSNNDHFHDNMEYLYNKLSANEEANGAENDISKEGGDLQFMGVPFPAVAQSEEVNKI